MLRNPAMLQAFPSTEPVAEFPCTVAQRRHWALDRINPGDPTLNIAARWRMEGQVVPSVLEQSLQQLVDRHEMLRTGFVERDGGPVQIVVASALIELRLIDLTDLAEPERSASAAEEACEEARRPFDVTRPPLLRATLLRLGTDLSELMLTTHHMVGDCWSNSVLTQEIASNYEQLRQGRAGVLPPLEMQFGDYALWQEAWLKQGGADQAEAYWQQQLAGRREFHVTTDRPPPRRPAGAGIIMGMPVPAELAEAVQGLARRNGTTFFMLGVAVLATVLHRWTGAAEVVFGTQVSGRDEIEIERMVGPLVNTVVLRVDMTGNPTFAALLDSVRETVGDALEHAAAPIERVLEQIGPDGGGSGRRHSLTAVNFVLIHEGFTRDGLNSEFVFKGVPSMSPGSRFDLNIFLVERPTGWRASCEYDPELFDRSRVDWLLRSFLGVLDLVSRDPTCRLASVSLADDPLSPQMPRLVEPHAQRLPDAYAPLPQPVPADVVERLAALWARVLRQPSVPRDANFFALGGDSIRAAQLLALTRQDFGRGITLGQMFKAPTLSAMAALLQDDGEMAPAGVVWVQPHGSKPPVFAINNTGIFYTLANHLGPDQPFAAIQALDPEISPSLHPRDFRAIAARYVDVIRQVRPHGPYSLIGLCAAGKVAFEVAQQLRAAGEEIRLLAVVDSWAPGHWQRLGTGRRMRALARLRAIRFGRQIQRIREGTLSVRGFLANRAVFRGIRNASYEWMRRTGQREAVPPGVQNNLFVTCLDASAQRYVPRPYAGDVLVFYGPEQPRGADLDPSFGWEGLVAGEVTVVAVPADPQTAFVDHHQGLFQDPGARVMADALARILLPHATV